MAGKRYDFAEFFNGPKSTQNGNKNQKAKVGNQNKQAAAQKRKLSNNKKCG